MTKSETAIFAEKIIQGGYGNVFKDFYKLPFSLGTFGKEKTKINFKESED